MNTFIKFAAILAILLVTAQPSFASAEESGPDQAALETALDQLKEKLTGISEDIFLREQTLDNGKRLFQIIWEAGGQTSKITLELRPLGQYNHQPVFGLFAYTTVAEANGGSMPPAVIKAVAIRNETTVLGFFSMPESFDTVYINMTTPSDTLTSGQLWMICAWLHKNSIEFKDEINSILKATG